MKFDHILKQFHGILSDPIAFISRLEIVGKDGRIIKLIPNDEQVRIIRALESGEV